MGMNDTPTTAIAQGLAKKIDRAEIVLFLGAGINEGRFPTWDKLLRDVVEHAVHYGWGNQWSCMKRKDIISWLGEKHSYQPSFYERASLAKRLLRKQYLHVVHQKLYKPVDHSFSQRGDAGTSYLEAIVKLCQNEQVRAVVTYNYDDSLELHMQAEHARNPRLRKPISFCSQRLASANHTGLPVYHVHGLLPRIGYLSEIDNSTFVFSYEEYYRMLSQPFNWQTSHQLYFLRSCACLFLGVSLNDMNMLRLLSHAHEYAATPGIFVLWCDEDIHLPKGKDRESIIAVRREFCREFGSELVLCGRNYRDVHAVIDSLADNLVVQAEEL